MVLQAGSASVSDFPANYGHKQSCGSHPAIYETWNKRLNAGAKLVGRGATRRSDSNGMRVSREHLIRAAADQFFDVGLSLSWRRFCAAWPRGSDEPSGGEQDDGDSNERQFDRHETCTPEARVGGLRRGAAQRPPSATYPTKSERMKPSGLPFLASLPYDPGYVLVELA